MTITEIAFSCYAVSDIARAKAFYTDVLGLACTMDHELADGAGHWVEFDIGAGTLAIGCSPGWEPSSQGCTVALEVDDFDAACQRMEDQGTAITMGPLETDVCHMLMIADPDGNPLILHKRKAATAIEN